MSNKEAIDEISNDRNKKCINIYEKIKQNLVIKSLKQLTSNEIIRYSVGNNITKTFLNTLNPIKPPTTRSLEMLLRERDSKKYHLVSIYIFFFIQAEYY